MSGIRISPSPYVNPPAKPAQADPVTPQFQLTAPEIVPPPLDLPALKADDIKAIIHLKDGNKIYLTEHDLIPKKSDLQRDEYLIKKYEAFHKILSQNKDRLSSHPEFSDISLAILYKLDSLIALARSGNLPTEVIFKMIEELGAAINQLPDSFKDKPFLMAIVIKQLWEAKLISKEMAESLFIQLIKAQPVELIQFFFAGFFGLSFCGRSVWLNRRWGTWCRWRQKVLRFGRQIFELKREGLFC